VFVFKAHNLNINDTIDLHCNCCYQSQKSFSWPTSQQYCHLGTCASKPRNMTITHSTRH